MILDWHFKTFDELSTHELYQMLRLRTEVFVVEQRCCFLDMDNKDQLCHHLLGYRNGVLVAVSRIVPPGISYEHPSIGRIVVSASARGIGAGVELLNVSIEKLERLYGKAEIRIGAQLYLKRFYESFGFMQSSVPYLEDEINHIEMTRRAGYKAD
ncbi:GNAT family N-acetyltransferase [Dyadobacter sp. CY343]|uniref:GNAT family N-acetyltransferase n=1 Tax=Dyadobacter sp. CY343 TaxID=2907299 RepID=UPI001F394ECB|nr:GNAT family N-acetyltransferase [Dyadobacter sp. CY343]MCE7061085.1 GNAT family N-acetyltransferase [Dyadobacter sp. CY343]